MIWAVGCSNGGMFTYTMASHELTRDFFAGTIPMVGLPHWGFNHGPGVPMSLSGMWGLNDDTVPPVSGENDAGVYVQGRTSQPNGWYYTSAAKVTHYWARMLGCDDRQEVPPPNDDLVRCWTYDNCM